jgi:hypothetical protein
MRVVKLNGCGQPIAGAGGGMSVTKGFVSVALTANINEPEDRGQERRRPDLRP